MRTLQIWLRRLFFPALALVFLLAIIGAAALVYVFSHQLTDSPLAYAAYLLSAYALVLVCVRIPALVRLIRRGICALPFGARLLEDLPFRQKVLLHMTLAINLLYAAFHLAGGLFFRTSWLDAAAVYYLILSVVQFQLVRDLRRGVQDPIQALKRYRACGKLLCLLTVVVLFMVFDLVRAGHGTVYPGTMVYAVALYAFFSLITAIINFIRFHRRRDPLMSAAKSVSLATALVAIFSLQATMLTTFDGTPLQLQRSANLTGGICICLLILLLAVMMILRSGSKLKKLNTSSHKEVL